LFCIPPPLADAYDRARHPQAQPLARAEFSTIRSCLLKVALRVRESASRVHLAFAANWPEAVLFRGLLRGLLPRPT
jgi:hypothetical protein